MDDFKKGEKQISQGRLRSVHKSDAVGVDRRKMMKRRLGRVELRQGIRL